MLFKRTILVLLILISGLLVSDLFAYGQPDPRTYDEAAVIERINRMENDVVAPRYTSVVKSYVKTYTMWNPDKTQGILGRAVMYFPIFDKYIAAYEMPKDIRILSIVESALRADAVSHAGAVGLWQFMPATGKEMGLKIDRYVDERCDPHKSTEAAMRYLKKQYNRFGSWELALAAYNGGSGRVNRAVKRGRSSNFWRIRKYLPKETRNYIPAFIGAAYMMNYYDEHGIFPVLPSLDAQLTETITIYDYLTILRISKLTNMAAEEIEFLNPAYKRGFIPSNVKGNTLTLPNRVMGVVKEYLDSRRPDKRSATTAEEDANFNFYPSTPLLAPDEYYRSVTYVVAAGESIYELANEFNIPVAAICAWNNMKYPFVSPGRELTLYGVKLKTVIEVEELPKIEPVEVVEELPIRPLVELEEEGDLPENTREEDGVLYYTITEKESLNDIAAKFSSVSVQDLMILNNLRSNQIPKVGKVIKVRKIAAENRETK